MIRYSPIDSDPSTKPVSYLPKTCFVMAQIRPPISGIQSEIRLQLSNFLKAKGFHEIDSGSSVTGRDFLVKIWNIAFQVPIGIAIITRSTPRKTLANIFYEMGLLQAFGKETLVIKTKDAGVPSDFIRTEYVVYDNNLKANLHKYFDFVSSLRDHFDIMAEQLERDPLLAIDYMRRAFLLTGETSYRKKAKQLYNRSRGAKRASNCVENLLTNF